MGTRMSEMQHRKTPGTKGFLSRFARDTRGNTMAIMATALIPLAGMVGGGVDISRMYIVKTRLQHACDAGALAGRKAMGGGTWSQSNYAPRTSAENFFDANYQSDAYGATDRQRSFTENAGKVTGTASAVLPMTLMRIFGRTTETLSVTCDAEMRLPNTDVMFVLDTTGSMGDTPAGDTQSKMVSLKSAVKCFYEIVARLDTDEECTTGTPSGGTGDQVQIRFGFVPYATNVNVGRLLPTAYFANSWPYQSREEYSRGYTYPNPGTPSTTGSTTSWGSPGSWQDKSKTTSGNSTTYCQNNVPPTTAPFNNGSLGSAYNSVATPGGNPVGSTQTVTYKRDQPIQKTEYRYDSYRSSNNTCRYDERDTDGTTTYSYTRTDVGVPNVTWHYGQIDQPISGLKNGTSWNNSLTLPIGTDGANKTISWDGCIEERATAKQTSYSPIPSSAKDLDIDLVPSQGTPSTLWGPALPGMIYTRNATSASNDSTWLLSPDQYTTTDYVNGSDYYCPAAAKKLQAWPNADAFDTYVDSLSPNGNTYHDIGLLWGGRLASPTGIFASENEYTPQGGEIERHIIFMTDGDPCTSGTNYNAYGVAWFDRRQTATGTDPGKTQNCTEGSVLTDQVNARTAAICTAIKNKNITLWVITFGTLDSRTVTRMTACATSGRYFNATNEATIQATFKSIADQISQLRLTK
jgi:Flp pilus assembly protein TadG